MRKKIKYIPYYSYDDIGKLLLSELHLNDTLRFKNSNGKIREYLICKIVKRKEDVTNCDWYGKSCETYYYYDHVIFSFLRIDNISIGPDSLVEYSTLDMQMQLPIGIDKTNIADDVKAKTVLFGRTFVDYNIIPQTPFSVGYINFPDFYAPLNLTVFTNNVRKYEDVIVIESGNNNVYTDPYSGNNYTINEIWFDRKYGIVSFKDVNNNIWNRIN